MSASAKVEPLSTLVLMAITTRFREALSIWLARMSRHCTSGRPASIIVANCLVKIRMSLPLTPEPICGRWNSAGFFFTFTGARPRALSRVSTALASSASISPFLVSPERVLASHSHCLGLGAVFAFSAVVETAMSSES